MDRAITAVSRTVCTITFDSIAPVRLKYNGFLGIGLRFTIHASKLKLIKLFLVASPPFGPSGELLELAPGEVSKFLFCRGDSMGVDGIDDILCFFWCNRVCRKIKFGVLKCSNMFDDSIRYFRDIFWVGRSIRVEEMRLLFK